MFLVYGVSLDSLITIEDSSRDIYKLILGENTSKNQNSIQWDLECQEAFDKLKELCTTTPILAYADFVKPFKLHTDASV